MSPEHRNLERVFFPKLADIAGLKRSAHKNDKVPVNVNPLLRATAGASVLAKGGELYKQVELSSQK